MIINSHSGGMPAYQPSTTNTDEQASLPQHFYLSTYKNIYNLVSSRAQTTFNVIQTLKSTGLRTTKQTKSEPHRKLYKKKGSRDMLVVIIDDNY